MPLTENTRRRLYEDAGFEADVITLIDQSVDAIGQLLPHTELARQWRVAPRIAKTRVRAIEGRRGLELSLKLSASTSLMAILRRRRSHRADQGNVRIDSREADLALRVLQQLEDLLKIASAGANAYGMASRLTSDLTELAVARHLEVRHGLGMDVPELFRRLRRLAEESYEGRSVATGIIVETGDRSSTSDQFVRTFSASKKYKAMCDGYRTAYGVSGGGRGLGIRSLNVRRHPPGGVHYFPEWARAMAEESTGGNLGISLTRQGDILIFERSSLILSYRRGVWQYWNHAHMTSLLIALARAQRVPPARLRRVVCSIYRTAMNLAFRGSGGMLVLLRSRAKLGDLVRAGDEIGASTRAGYDRSIDSQLRDGKIDSVDPLIVAALASIDGAIVLSRSGRILAYGAVLLVPTPHRHGMQEGSRSKAAISASRYGIVAKISSDGDITFFTNGAVLMRI